MVDYKRIIRSQPVVAPKKVSQEPKISMIHHSGKTPNQKLEDLQKNQVK
jgi:hypothetical protein